MDFAGACIYFYDAALLDLYKPDLFLVSHAVHFSFLFKFVIFHNLKQILWKAYKSKFLVMKIVLITSFILFYAATTSNNRS